MIYNAMIFNGPKEVKGKKFSGEFPAPSSLGPGWTIADGSIYAIAWDFQDLVRALRKQVLAAVPLLERLFYRSKMPAVLLQSGLACLPNMVEYLSPAMQNVLSSATRALAANSGVSYEMLGVVYKAVASA
jgi:hypothetical protein